MLLRRVPGRPQFVRTISGYLIAFTARSSASTKATRSFQLSPSAPTCLPASRCSRTSRVARSCAETHHVGGVQRIAQIAVLTEAETGGQARTTEPARHDFHRVVPRGQRAHRQTAKAFTQQVQQVFGASRIRRVDQQQATRCGEERKAQLRTLSARVATASGSSRP